MHVSTPTVIDKNIIVKADQNRLIMSLAYNTKQELLRGAHLKQFEKGEVLETQGEFGRNVFFTLSGLLISIFEGKDGTGIANAMRGPEAAYGAISSGSSTAQIGTGRVIAQMPSEFLIISKANFSKILMKSNDLLRVILAHAAEIVRNHEVTLNCSRHHKIDKRLAHLLTLLNFYNKDPELPATHSELGEILGVRRESVSTALSEYEKSNLIDVSRGRIYIRDIQRLENLTCECHQELLRLRARELLARTGC
ncbi:MAG TPA: Crp/Fnr family transcriptional regulator [Dehalococcoidia bacterium]|nr:Crp/Fnr family transcriptional regulator [Dehalococcoidia bacterium]